MVFVYTIYDFVLAEKTVVTTLKKEEQPRKFTLQIITPAVEFIGMPFGGGLVKQSRLYDERGKLIGARNYSAELKSEIKNIKSECTIPYFRLWKGMFFIALALVIAAVVFGIKNKIDNNRKAKENEAFIESLQHLKEGQLYGATFFTNSNGENINGLPQGWIKITGIKGDTLFIQRSKKVETDIAIFAMKNIAAIKPQSNADWEEKIEKMNYQLLRKQLEKPDQTSFDVMYIEPDPKKYSGVILTIEGIE